MWDNLLNKITKESKSTLFLLLLEKNMEGKKKSKNVFILFWIQSKVKLPHVESCTFAPLGTTFVQLCSLCSNCAKLKIGSQGTPIVAICLVLIV
jgi:hypothetical protein